MYEELRPEEQELYHNDKELYCKITQGNGKSLHMSKSGADGETWVPLMEKAFAKLHGDYMSMNGGWPGDAIEDLTGCVVSPFQWLMARILTLQRIRGLSYSLKIRVRRN